MLCAMDIQPTPPLPPEAFNATKTKTWPNAETRRVRVTWFDHGPDNKGRRSFCLEWNDDYSPTFGSVPQARAQVFRAKPSDHFVLDAGASPDTCSCR